jgi:hypothetical protein
LAAQISNTERRQNVQENNLNQCPNGAK